MAIAALGAVPAHALTTPPLIWRDASRIVVQCLVYPTDASLQAELCERVSRMSARGAPAPVSVVPLGDPAVLAPDTVALLVHASVQPQGRNRLLAFTVRPFRASAEQTALLYGAAPRAALIPASATASPGLDAALRAALSETLPWQAGPQAPRPIKR